MKPIIGITTDYAYGLNELYGVLGRQINWNILPSDYIKGIEMAGGVPLIIPVLSGIEDLESIIATIDGLILSGGADVCPKYYGEVMSPKNGSICPERDAYELCLARQVIETSDIPVLGICRGHQLLNVALGGSLYQDLCNYPKSEQEQEINHYVLGSPKYNPVHEVTLKSNSLIAKIYNKELIYVNSYHHQGIKEIAYGFEATAFSREGIIEAIEMKNDRFVVSVQWHPEMMIEHNEEQRKILQAFVQACMKNKRHD